MPHTEPPLPALDRERGYLLIADMEQSTRSKFVLGAESAFHALREHNRLVIAAASGVQPVGGIVLNALGDAVVLKFPAHDDDDAALRGCLAAARAIVQAFETLAPVASTDGRSFRVRTKLMLQRYDAFRYHRSEDSAIFAEELVGPDIDLAFRLAPVAWRLQVLASEAFVEALLDACEHDAETPPGAQTLLDQAHRSRHLDARTPGPLRGVAAAGRIGELDFWITDAREIARLKGIVRSRRLFALSFESPAALVARGQAQRLTIKVRQDHHAIILARVSLARHDNENYIEHVVNRLRDSSDGHRLDSELTLCLAAKIYGEFDFFFRVSCIDDESLRRFFNAIHDDTIGVSHVEVRSTVTNRFALNPHYPSVVEQFGGRPHEIVLTWFERNPARDVYGLLTGLMEDDDGSPAPVRLLEVGEVIHHTPVYAIFACEGLREYAAFFADHGLAPTAAHSHVGHVDRASDAQLRYSLMGGVYFPPRDLGEET